MAIAISMLYLGLRQKDKLQQAYYRQPGRLVFSHIGMFTLLLIMLYLLIQPLVKLVTGFTGTSYYQDVFHYRVVDQAIMPRGLSLFHCDSLVITLVDMHENASFCLNTQVNAPDNQQIINRSETHRLRIRGRRGGLGIRVISVELVALKSPVQ